MRRSAIGLVPILILASCLSILLAGCGPSASSSTIGNGPSVHICTARSFDSATATCKHDAASVSASDLVDARLAFSNGANAFASGDSHFVVSHVNTDGTTSDIGTASNSDSSMTQYSNYAVLLAWVIHQAGPGPLRHMLYRIEVDNGNSKLGTADFTYHPSGPSAHICTKGHFNKQLFVCTRDDRSLSESAFASAVVVYSEGDGTPFAGTNTHYIISVVNKDGTSAT